jgi:hypothetical protein
MPGVGILRMKDPLANVATVTSPIKASKVMTLELIPRSRQRAYKSRYAKLGFTATYRANVRSSNVGFYASTESCNSCPKSSGRISMGSGT